MAGKLIVAGTLFRSVLFEEEGQKQKRRMTSCILRSRLTAYPVLELETRHALEFAHIVSDKSEPYGFGMSCDPESTSSGIPCAACVSVACASHAGGSGIRLR